VDEVKIKEQLAALAEDNQRLQRVVAELLRKNELLRQQLASAQ
jgi:hypothetical protein